MENIKEKKYRWRILRKAPCISMICFKANMDIFCLTRNKKRIEIKDINRWRIERDKKNNKKNLKKKRWKQHSRGTAKFPAQQRHRLDLNYDAEDFEKWSRNIYYLSQRSKQGKKEESNQGEKKTNNEKRRKRHHQN